jgi:hypothetical protein
VAPEAGATLFEVSPGGLALDTDDAGENQRGWNMFTKAIKNIGAVCLGTAFFGAAGTANAIPSFYDDMTAFDTAAAAVTLNLDTLDSHPSGSLPSSANGITISTNNNGKIDTSPEYGSGHVVSFYTASGGTEITFTFSTPINAFGIDVFDLGTDGPTTFTVALLSDSMGYNLPDTDIRGLKSFFGVVDTATTFSTVILTNSDSGDYIELDNVQYGKNAELVLQSPANDVPEPGTLALFGIGLAGLGFARRRRAA